MSKRIFKSQEIKIAVIAIVSLFLIVWGINFLKGKNIFSKHYTYYSVFDNAGGLLPANTVYINGVTVGIVDKIALVEPLLDKVLVTFTVKKKIKIPTDSKIKIVSPGIVGSLQLECVLGKADTYFTDGDTIIGEIQPGLLADIDHIKYNIDTVITSLKDLIQKGGIQASIDNIHSTTDRLDSIMHSGKIESIIADVEDIINVLNNNKTEIDSVIKNVNTFSGSLAETDIPATLNELSARLKQAENILANIEKGEGTLGKLNTNDSLYNDLHKTINSLDLLITDIKANPKRYINVTIFGRKKK